MVAEFGVKEKVGKGITVTLLVAWQVPFALLALSVYVAEEVKLLTTWVMVFETLASVPVFNTEPGALKVNELMDVFVKAVSVADCPEHSMPELVRVTEHTMPQLVTPAPGVAELVWAKVICWLTPAKLVIRTM